MGILTITWVAFIFSVLIFSLSLSFLVFVNREEEELDVFSQENATISIQDAYMMPLQIINYPKF